MGVTSKFQRLMNLRKAEIQAVMKGNAKDGDVVISVCGSRKDYDERAGDGGSEGGDW
jgi:hypothetical protein